MLFIAKVMACGFITFYSLPDAMPFLVRLTMMAVTQIAVGPALRNADPEQADEPSIQRHRTLAPGPTPILERESN